MKTLSVKGLFAAITAVLFVAAGFAADPGLLSHVDYVQDGLIAQWDGICNATNGAGVAFHDPNATTWVDLTGRHENMIFDKGAVIAENCYDVSNDHYCYITRCVDIAQAVVAGGITVEILCDFSSLTVESGALFACLDKDSNRALWIRCNPHGDAGSGCVASGEYYGKNAWAVGAGTGVPSFDDREVNYVRLYTFVGDAKKLDLYKDASASVSVKVTDRGPSSNKCDVDSAWFSIGRRISFGGSSATCADMKVYALRVYNRCLNAEERKWNKAVDDYRFRPESHPIPVKLPCSLDSYCTNGLLAKWDGVYKTLRDGVPVIDETVAQWDDLTGSSTSFSGPQMTFKAGCVTVNSISGTAPSATNTAFGVPYSPHTVQATAKCQTFAAHDLYLEALWGWQGYGNLGWQMGYEGCTLRLYFNRASDQKRETFDALTWDNVTAAARSYTAVVGTGEKGALYVNDDRVQLTSVDYADGPYTIEDSIYIGSRFGTSTAYDMYSFRVYDRALTEAEIVANNAVDAVRFLGKSYTNLVVGTDLVEAGPVSPDYGAYVGIKSGGVVDCTAPRDGKAKGCDYKCLGYTLYTNNAAGAWCDWKSNTTTSVVYQQPAGAVRLVWHWKRKPGFMLLLR